VYHLTHATLYLATAPKSNSAGAYFRALGEIEQGGHTDVHSHLKDATRRQAQRFGHGVGYFYPHDFPEHWVAQQYLPDALVGRRFYQPSDQGYERKIAQPPPTHKTRPDQA
jgi:putative ATPase